MTTTTNTPAPKAHPDLPRLPPRTRWARIPGQPYTASEAAKEAEAVAEWRECGGGSTRFGPRLPGGRDHLVLVPGGPVAASPTGPVAAETFGGRTLWIDAEGVIWSPVESWRPSAFAGETRLPAVGAFGLVYEGHIFGGFGGVRLVHGESSPVPARRIAGNPELCDALRRMGWRDPLRLADGALVEEL